MEMRYIALVVMEFAAVVHLVFSLVNFNFARRSVRYLSEAWVLLLISLVLFGGVGYLLVRPFPTPEILSPTMLIILMVCSYLQSIFPLSIPMPGYLQWERMWRYASPAIVLIAIYAAGMLMGSNTTRLESLSDLGKNFLSGDVVLRILMLIVTFYYISNIVWRPKRLLPRYKISPDILLYGTALGIAALFMVCLSIRFSVEALMVYLLYITAVDAALAMRVLKPILALINVPEIKPVATPPADDNLQTEDEENFNEMNLKRFEKVEYTMQTLKPYTDCDFTRERLCREVGLNRHLLLQCLRANGYNDIHEYISRYRVAELKRLIENGTLKDLKSIERAGFRIMKTAMVSFEKFEHTPLLEFFEAHQPKATTPEADSTSAEDNTTAPTDEDTEA